MMPKRVQLSRAKDWRMPPNTVKVDQSTKWGNPWIAGAVGIADAAEAVRRFRCAVIGPILDGKQCRPFAHPESRMGRVISDAPKELAGKDLACWCALDAPCHADVLLELANGQLTDSSAKPSVISEGGAADASGSVSASNENEGPGGGCDG